MAVIQHTACQAKAQSGAKREHVEKIVCVSPALPDTESSRHRARQDKIREGSI